MTPQVVRNFAEQICCTDNFLLFLRRENKTATFHQNNISFRNDVSHTTPTEQSTHILEYFFRTQRNWHEKIDI